MSGLLLPNDLKQISSDAEMAKMDEEERAKRKKAEQQAELREAFLAREIHAEAIERINKAVRIAAQRGHHQVEVITFPCSFCTDGGRRINIADPEWPSTLEGFAKRAYDFYAKELRPLGYKLHAEIISFPGGMPGEIGLYLKW
jgi:sugar phosphate isomerase/epimerase